MLIEVLKSKIHRATVTDMDLNYIGSIGIDNTLMSLAGIAENEKVLIANMRNGTKIRDLCSLRTCRFRENLHLGSGREAL